ncbi:hypothetical protein P154DRAFT_535321 [Amniculicola lignicola CBS 123094]|uniref:Uncharacterized protein n=1 Tax=Amniculicola lignicola CBS 123094 TaxID=1392246 RepID=A0A6A5WFK8_9PLEO|nr:hypothetical protein P154DRAFT_535321 [Amniculicola lignicola CBS 123094]
MGNVLDAQRRWYSDYGHSDYGHSDYGHSDDRRPKNCEALKRNRVMISYSCHDFIHCDITWSAFKSFFLIYHSIRETGRPRPVSAVGIGIIAASLIVTKLEGCIKDCGYFEPAVTVTDEFRPFKGYVASLTDINRYEEYVQRMGMNAALVETILCRVRPTLKALTKMSLDRDWMSWSNTYLCGTENHGSENGKTTSQMGTTTGLTHKDMENSNSSSSAPRISFSMQPMKSIDPAKFAQIFESSYIPLEMRKY